MNEQPRYEQPPSYEKIEQPGSIDGKISKDLQETFQRLVVNTAMLINARAASLALVSPGSKNQTPLVTYCPDGPWPARSEYEGIARWVAARQSPALIDQSSIDPREHLAGASLVGSVVCVPLLAGRDVLGTLLLAHPGPRAFHTQHVRLLEMMADMAAALIIQARQQEAAAMQAQVLGMVVEVGRALSNTKDIRQVLSLTTTGIRRLVICEEAVLFSYEAATQELRGVAGLGTQSARLAEQRIQITDAHSVTAWVARARRPLLHSSGSRTFVGRLTDTLLTRADLALLAVPLVAQNQLWGVITLARPQPFDTTDLRAMLNLSSFAAPALAQASSAVAGR